MITPSCDEILELAEEYTTIPVCREIYADMTTPIALLRRLQTRSDRFFLLESVEGGEKWARYSFLGYDPILRATCKTFLRNCKLVRTPHVRCRRKLRLCRARKRYRHAVL